VYALCAKNNQNALHPSSIFGAIMGNGRQQGEITDKKSPVKTGPFITFDSL